MKKIFRLFPVALAVVALASCSDDLTALNTEEGQFELNPNYLYVSVENDNPITRAAYVSANVQAKEQANGNDFFRTLYWSNGDQIKLYSEKNNWRPQIWAYDDALTGALPSQYKKENGFSVFKQAVVVAEHDGEQDAQYTDGYGVMPANLSEFTNELRTKLTFNLEGLRYVQFSQEKLAKTASASETATDAADLYYGFGALNVYKSTAPLPLWGVATTGQMKCKWLTGHLCVDLTNFQDNIIPQAPLYAGVRGNNYLVIQSTKSLWGEFSAINFDPDDINVAPVLTAEAAAATTITDGVTKIGDLGKDCIVLNLGSEAMKRVIAYAPIMCDGATTVTATLYQGLPATDFESAKTVVLNAVAGWAADPMVAESIEAGKLYRIVNEDARTIETANTPYSLQQQLLAMDAEMERDYVVTINNDVLVKTANTNYKDMATSVADDHNYVLDLSGIDFKHNVTITFAAGKGFTNNEITPATDKNYLFVKTKANGKKKVTIDLGVGKAANNIKAIVVDNNLGSQLVLKGAALTDATQPVAVVNYGTAAANGKLTVADAATNVYTAGAINIDAVNADIAKLNLLNNSANDYTVALKNGTIKNTIALATAVPDVDAVALGAVAKNVTIDATGKSAIADNITLTGFAGCVNGGGHKVNGLFFTSTWDGSKFADEAAASITTGKIFTAAQLASIAGNGTNNYVVMGDIDLNNETWTSVATLTKNFSGANKKAGLSVGYTSGGVCIEEIVYPTISKLSAPLFNNIALAAAGEIKNFKLSGADITAVSGNQGVLAGAITLTAAANNVTITNVDVENSEIDATGKVNVGGLVGNIDGTYAATVAFNGCDVTGLALTGNKYLGGLVGYVAKMDPVVTVGTGALCTFGGTFTLTPTTGVIYDPAYKAVGQFIGGHTRPQAGKVTIKVPAASLNAALTVNGADADGLDLYTQKGKYGIGTGTVVYYDVVMGNQTVMGYSGYYNQPAAASIISQYTSGSDTYSAQNWTTAITKAWADANTPYLYYINQ